MHGVNWLGVALALVAGQVIGFLWYGVVFQKAWLRLSGVVADQSKGVGAAMGVGALINLIVVFGLANLIHMLGIRSALGGAHIALFASVFFAATTVALRAVYSSETFQARPWKLFLIDAGYLVVHFTVAGAILGALAAIA